MMVGALFVVETRSEERVFYCGMEPFILKYGGKRENLSSYFFPLVILH